MMKHGTQSIIEYARMFKALCDQLHAVGRPVDGTDKVHWFLCGLDSNFSSFSMTQMAQTPIPSFADLIFKVESFEIFQKSLQSSSSSATDFITSKNSTHRGGSSGNHQGCTSGHGGGSSNHKNICSTQAKGIVFYNAKCRMDNHYTNYYCQRYDRSEPTTHLVEVFNSSRSDWFMDMEASAHMTMDYSHLDKSEQYMGKDCIVVGYGMSLPITYTSKFSPSPIFIFLMSLSHLASPKIYFQLVN